MKIDKLSPQKLWIANNIISAYSFYYMVGDRLLTNTPLSNVRMGDGERHLLQSCLDNGDQGRIDEVVTDYDEAWRTRMGIEGITYRALRDRILEAGNACSHFAPSVSGLVQKSYDLFNHFNLREQYIDNFFVNIWGNDAKAELFKAAGHVLFIHRNRGTADAMQINAKRLFGVRVTYIELNNWTQAEDVIKGGQDSEARMVLFAGGPASKYISPRIAESNKVVLDIGNTTDYWTFAQ